MTGAHEHTKISYNFDTMAGTHEHIYPVFYYTECTHLHKNDSIFNHFLIQRSYRHTKNCSIKSINVIYSAKNSKYITLVKYFLQTKILATLATLCIITQFQINACNCCTEMQLAYYNFQNTKITQQLTFYPHILHPDNTP